MSEIEIKETKIKAKCPTCKKRMRTNSETGVHCSFDLSHAIKVPLTFQTMKKGAGPKWRRKGSKSN